MINLQKNDLESLQKLSRIHLEQEEEHDLHNNLQKILEYVAQLSEIDTEGIPPCDYVLQLQKEDIRREDEVGSLFPREEFLDSTPDQVGSMVRVPPII